MPLNNAQNRFSAIALKQPWRGKHIIPSGTVNQAERQASAFLYSGILAPAPPVVLSSFIVENVVRHCSSVSVTGTINMVITELRRRELWPLKA